jgi:hypothetical protein
MKGSGISWKRTPTEKKYTHRNFGDGPGPVSFSLDACKANSDKKRRNLFYKGKRGKTMLIVIRIKIRRTISYAAVQNL